MLLMQAGTLRGQVERGWALEIETFLGPVNAIPPGKRLHLPGGWSEKGSLLLFLRFVQILQIQIVPEKGGQTVATRIPHKATVSCAHKPDSVLTADYKSKYHTGHQELWAKITWPLGQH
jgi:hypothetical protein